MIVDYDIKNLKRYPFFKANDKCQHSGDLQAVWLTLYYVKFITCYR